MESTTDVKPGDWVRFYREVDGHARLVIGVVQYVRTDDAIGHGWTGGEIITDIGSLKREFVVETRRNAVL